MKTKTRIEVLTNDSHETILAKCGYNRVRESVYKKDETTFKIAWLHSNSWGQLAFIDLIEL
jgi:hypothetical protein